MKSTRHWTLLVLVCALAAALVVSACGDDDDDGDGAAAPVDVDFETLEAGVLTVGSDIPFEPFEQGDPPDYEGFDIDLINEVADRMELETAIEDAPFNLLLRGGGGQFDLAVAATTILPERERKVDFSDPYFIATQSLLVRAGEGIESIEDLEGRIVGAQDGTTGERFAIDNANAKEVRPFPEIDNAYNQLQNGQVDAVINDLPSTQQAAEDKQGLEVVEVFDTGEEYGIIIPEQSDDLREAVNAALQEVKDDGTLNELYQKWFQTDAPEALLTATHEPS